MYIDADALLYNYKRNPPRFAKLRAELLKDGFTDREIIDAMYASRQLVARGSRSPRKLKASGARRKDAAGYGAGGGEYHAPENRPDER